MVVIAGILIIEENLLKGVLLRPWAINDHFNISSMAWQ